MSAAPDRFERAVSAFRVRTAGDGDGGATRVAIVRGLSRQSRRGRGVRLLGAVLALALAVPVAHAGWETWKGLLTQRSLRAAAPAPEPQKAKGARRPGKAPPVVTPAVEPTPVVEHANPFVEEPPQEPAKTPPGPSSPADELALYARAHELHFRGDDPGKALSAWSVYLTKFPKGQLAPEARYNRAICLVRLGRVEDAKVALADLAASTPAEHLRTQAQRLLKRLDAR